MSHPVPLETLQTVLAKLAEGETLTDAGKAVGHHRSILSKRFRGDPALLDAYEAAVQQGIEANLERAAKEAQQASDSNEIQKARLIWDIAKWTASKRYAQVYGDKIDMSASDGVTITLGITRKPRTIDHDDTEGNGPSVLEDHSGSQAGKDKGKA